MEFIDEASDAERRWPISRENSGEWAASRTVEKVTHNRTGVWGDRGAGDCLMTGIYDRGVARR